MIDRKQMAVIHDYDSLHKALRERKAELEITFNTLDEVAGFTSGHASKLLAPRPLKNIGGTTLGLMLQGLGVQLIMEEDPEAMERISAKLTKSKLPPVVLAVKNGRGRTRLVSKRFMRKIAPSGGRARMEKMTAKQRSAHGKRAIRMRWRKPKLIEITALASKPRARS